MKQPNLLHALKKNFGRGPESLRAQAWGYIRGLHLLRWFSEEALPRWGRRHDTGDPITSEFQMNKNYF